MIKRNTVVVDVPEWLDFRAEAAEIRDHYQSFDYYKINLLKTLKKLVLKFTLHSTIKKRLKSL